MSALGRAAPRLAAAFQSSPSPFLLMMDDLHELQSPACHDVLGVVISGIPQGSQLVAASRSDQPHLARLRTSQETLEFLASDLALGAEGAEQIFSEASVSISHEMAVTVSERTEGWPAGLYLAAMIARDGDGSDLVVSGDDRYVTDYLYRESLSQLPDSTKRFLRRTAVLEQMNASLCDAVLNASGSQNQLRELEAANSFLIPLDRTREWFRYHGLFREFLLGELRRVEPEEANKLHLRAADWYEANNSVALALEHLLNTTERDRSVHLLTELVLPTYMAGQISTVQSWMSTLGNAEIQEHPPLAVLAGWIAVLTGQTAESQRWAAIVEAASYDLVPADGTASFDSARAMLRAVMCADGPEQMLADTTLALAQEAPWSPWRDTALLLHAEAQLLMGDEASARVKFVEAISTAEQLGNTDNKVLAEAELALIAMSRGKWDEATQHVQGSLGVIEEYRMDDYATSILGFVAAARLALHRGDVDCADQQLTRAMRARPSCTFVFPYAAVRARVQLAKMHWTRGDASTARHLMREVDEILQQRPALGVLLDEVADFQEIVATLGQAGSGGAAPLTAAELRLLPYLQTHLTIGEIGERLFISRNTVSTEVASIYRKLGVSKRNDAVQQATAIGLLGG